MPDAELAKQFFVITPGIFQLGCRRYDGNARILAATDIDELVEDFRVIEFLLSPADRDQVATPGVISVIRGTHYFSFFSS